MLLCHDDELEGRRIAFILYLVPSSWSKKDGGTLDLFNLDGELQYLYLNHLQALTAVSYQPLIRLPKTAWT